MVWSEPAPCLPSGKDERVENYLGIPITCLHSTANETSQWQERCRIRNSSQKGRSQFAKMPIIGEIAAKVRPPSQSLTPVFPLKGWRKSAILQPAIGLLSPPSSVEPVVAKGFRRAAEFCRGMAKIRHLIPVCLPSLLDGKMLGFAGLTPSTIRRMFGCILNACWGSRGSPQPTGDFTFFWGYSAPAS